MVPYKESDRGSEGNVMAEGSNVIDLLKKLLIFYNHGITVLLELLFF
jgi:hypothetical protein